MSFFFFYDLYLDEKLKLNPIDFQRVKPYASFIQLSIANVNNTIDFFQRNLHELPTSTSVDNTYTLHFQRMVQMSPSIFIDILKFDPIRATIVDVVK